MNALAPEARRAAPDRPALIAHLLRTRMAGAVATPRENNLLHYRLLADRDPYYQLGLEPAALWTPDRILDLMVEKVGVDARLDHRSGQDTIDPELTAAALDRFAARFGRALRERQRVLFATGHPSSLTDMYQELADALREAGGTPLREAEGWSYEAAARTGGRRRLEIVYLLDVAVIEDPGGPIHTHSARPIRALLSGMAAAGRAMPDLVVSDHGWCGGAGQAGVDAIGFADCNDPALFVGEQEGSVQVAVPLDDGLNPDWYLPLARYVLAAGAPDGSADAPGPDGAAVGDGSGHRT